MTRPCPVPACGAPHDIRFVYCPKHLEAWFASPEASRCTTSSRSASMLADFTRRAALEGLPATPVRVEP